MKILCIEDGSIDIDDLENLKDGGVLVYRQGSTPPKVIEISQRDLYQEKFFVLNRKVEAIVTNIKEFVDRLLEQVKDKEIRKRMLGEFCEIMKTYGVTFLY